MQQHGSVNGLIHTFHPDWNCHWVCCHKIPLKCILWLMINCEWKDGHFQAGCLSAYLFSVLACLCNYYLTNFHEMLYCICVWVERPGTMTFDFGLNQDYGTDPGLSFRFLQYYELCLYIGIWATSERLERVKSSKCLWGLCFVQNFLCKHNTVQAEALGGCCKVYCLTPVPADGSQDAQIVKTGFMLWSETVKRSLWIISCLLELMWVQSVSWMRICGGSIFKI